MTPHVAATIDGAAGDDRAALARQFVPSADELHTGADELADPIGDDSPFAGRGHRASLSRPRAADAGDGLPGLLPLLLPARVGRRGDALTPARARRALSLHPRPRENCEVILSGGDPLALSPRRLQADRRGGGVRSRTSDYPRAHPPAGGRSRQVTPELVARSLRRDAVYVVLHCNHAAELSPRRRRACARLVDAASRCWRRPCCSKGVNDDAATLEKLIRALIRKPHQALLPAPSRPRPRHRAFPQRPRAGRALMRALARPAVGHRPADLRARHPGRPRQGAGRAGLPAQGAAPGQWIVTDPDGHEHPYPARGE